MKNAAISNWVRSSLKIQDNGDIFFPIPEDGKITLKDIQDAFPGSIGFRYKDEDCSTLNHILCRDGVFMEPTGGWSKHGRVYYVVKQDNSTPTAYLSRFESYRQNVEKSRNSNGHRGIRNSNNRDSCADNAGMVKIHIGRGHFVNGTFKRITANTLGGGIVAVGPFPKDKNCIEQIRDEAFKKFVSIHRELRKKITAAEQMSLVYPDGSTVCNLPDGSAEFTIKGYRDFLDPAKKFDRLRLYLVETAQLENDIEIISEESSDSLPDPFDVMESESISQVLLRDQQFNEIQAKETEMQYQTCSSRCSPTPGQSEQQMIDLTSDETIPLDIRVRFLLNGNSILTGKFDYTDKVENLVQYVLASGLQQEEQFRLFLNDEIMELPRRLYEYSLNTNEVVEITIKPAVERTHRVFARLGRHRLSLRRPGNTGIHVDNNPQVEDTTEAENGSVNVKDILDEHSAKVLTPTPTEDVIYFNNCNISRYYVMEDFFEYLEDSCSYDMNKKVKITFISTFGEHQDIEVAVDEGGPRREFFRLLMEALALTSGLFEGPDTLKVFSAKVSALRTRKYFYAGYAVAASLLMGGQPFCCLAPSIVDYIIYKQNKKKVEIEEVTDFELQTALKELKQTETTEELKAVIDDKLESRFQLGVDMPTSLLTIANKEELLNDICLSYVIHRTTAAIHQFMDGLESLGVLTLLRKHPSLRCLFEYSESFEVTSERVKQLLKFNFSERGSNKLPKEERLAKRFVDYIDDIHRTPRFRDEHEVTLSSLFAFITGLTKFPPLGSVEVAVYFVHDAVTDSLPTANTCGCVLHLPVYEGFEEKENFNYKLDTAILYAGGMHNI